MQTDRTGNKCSLRCILTTRGLMLRNCSHRGSAAQLETGLTAGKCAVVVAGAFSASVATLRNSEPSSKEQRAGG